ncbi:MAG: bifunctional DNA-formamidopyrimidine glycosylase/DNA-(apurinic or apyrimidinic site) lyase [Lentisphaeria bacterium]
MPELPEVETVRRALACRLVGRLIRAVRVFPGPLRTPVSEAALAAAVTGRRILSVRRRAKYLVVELEGRQALLLHLGMTGHFQVGPPSAAREKHTRVEWQLDRGLAWRYADPRGFGQVRVCTLAAAGALPDALAGLGPEPLEGAFSGATLATAGQGRRCAVKALILDQAVVAGVGNIYASEACFRAGVRPWRAAAALKRRDWERLAAAIRAVLEEAVACGGTTISDFRDVDGRTGRFDVRLQVYGRDGEPCQLCGDRIRRRVIAGRSSFYCPHCQK